MGIKGSLNKLFAILLIVTVGLVAVLDSPEHLENALSTGQTIGADRLVPSGINSAKALFDDDEQTLARAKDYKARFFNEDYVLIWLNSSRFRFALTGTNIDEATNKYRSFYGLGNLSPRYLLLTRYRDFVKLCSQQYSRFIHPLGLKFA